MGLESLQVSKFFGSNFFYSFSGGCCLLLKLNCSLQKPCCGWKKFMDQVHEYYLTTLKLFLTTYNMLPFNYNMMLVQKKNFSSLRSLVGNLKNGQNLLLFFVILSNKSTQCDFASILFDRYFWQFKILSILRGEHHMIRMHEHAQLELPFSRFETIFLHLYLLVLKMQQMWLNAKKTSANFTKSTVGFFHLKLLLLWFYVGWNATFKFLEFWRNFRFFSITKSRRNSFKFPLFWS